MLLVCFWLLQHNILATVLWEMPYLHSANTTLLNVYLTRTAWQMKSVALLPIMLPVSHLQNLVIYQKYLSKCWDLFQYRLPIWSCKNLVSLSYNELLQRACICPVLCDNNLPLICTKECGIRAVVDLLEFKKFSKIKLVKKNFEITHWRSAMISPNLWQTWVIFISNQYESESRCHLAQPKKKSYYSNLTLQSLSTPIWNYIPEHMKSAKTVNTFKSMLKSIFSIKIKSLYL